MGPFAKQLIFFQIKYFDFNNFLSRNTYFLKSFLEPKKIFVTQAWWALFFIDRIPVVHESTRGKILFTGYILHARALLDIRAVMTNLFVFSHSKEREAIS